MNERIRKAKEGLGKIGGSVKNKTKDHVRSISSKAGKHAINFKSAVNEKVKVDQIKKGIKQKHKKIRREIRKKVPMTEDEVGQTLERNIQKSQGIWENAGVVIFGQKALDNLTHHASIGLGIISMIIMSALLAFPTDLIGLSRFGIQFLYILVGLFISNIVLYILMKLLGSKTKFRVYFGTVNTSVLLSLICISLPLALLFFAVFATMSQGQEALNLVFNMIPFYNFLVLAWATEGLSRLKGIRGIIVGVSTLLIILFLNLVIPQLV